MHIYEYEESFYIPLIPLILYMELLVEQTPTAAVSADFWWSAVVETKASIGLNSPFPQHSA